MTGASRGRCRILERSMVMLRPVVPVVSRCPSSIVSSDVSSPARFALRLSDSSSMNRVASDPASSFLRSIAPLPPTAARYKARNRCVLPAPFLPPTKVALRPSYGAEIKKNGRRKKGQSSRPPPPATEQKLAASTRFSCLGCATRSRNSSCKIWSSSSGNPCAR